MGSLVISLRDGCSCWSLNDELESGVCFPSFCPINYTKSRTSCCFSMGSIRKRFKTACSISVVFISELPIYFFWVHQGSVIIILIIIKSQGFSMTVRSLFLLPPTRRLCLRFATQLTWLLMNNYDIATNFYKTMLIKQCK